MQSMNKIAYLIVALLLSVSISQAQQSRVYSQFFMNPFIYNPAYAGVEGHSVFFGMYRKQWSNIDGAPALSHVSFHTPLKGGLGIGFTAYNEQEGLINSTAIKASASYLLAIDRKHYLRVGMSLGGGTKSINTDGFDSPADPAFASLSESASFTLANFGATYHFGHFNVGFALPNLVGYEIVGSESFSKIKVDPLGEALFKINYRGHLNDDFAFEPHLLYRYNQNLPNQFELAMIAHLKHIVWVGASYRQDAGIVALFGTKVKEKIGIGFAYDIGNSNFNDILGPTFEIHIGYHLGTKKDHAEHVSSFIKSHRKSLDERQAEEQNKLEALKAKEDTKNKDRLTALRESRNNRLKDEAKEDSSAITNKPSTTTENTNVNNPTDQTNQSGTEKSSEQTEKESNKVVDQQKTDSKNDSNEETLKTNSEKPKNEVKEKAQSISDLIEKQREATKTASNTPKNNTVADNKNANQSETVKKTENKTNNNVPSKINTNKAKDVNNEKSVSETKPDEKLTDTSDAESKAAVIPNQTSETETKPDPVKNISDIPVEDNRSIDELAKSDLPKTVKKGNHLLELENGNYVIAGAFQVFDHAEDYSDELFEKGYRDVIVGYITETKLYYVVIFQSQSFEKAKRQRTSLQQREGFSKIWLLTVE